MYLEYFLVVALRSHSLLRQHVAFSEQTPMINIRSLIKPFELCIADLMSSLVMALLVSC